VNLHGELLVRILATRVVLDLMGFVLAPLRFDERVGSLTLPRENGIGDFAFSRLAIIICSALSGDRALGSR